MSEAQLKFISKMFAKTVIEKINVLGKNDAENDVVKYRNMLTEFTEFWGLNDLALRYYDDMVGAVLFSQP